MCVNSIEIIKAGEHQGKILVNYCDTPFSQRRIVADVKDIHSVVSLSNDDLGEQDRESNVIAINAYHEESSGNKASEPLILTL